MKKLILLAMLSLPLLSGCQQMSTITVCYPGGVCVEERRFTTRDRVQVFFFNDSEGVLYVRKSTGFGWTKVPPDGQTTLIFEREPSQRYAEVKVLMKLVFSDWETDSREYEDRVRFHEDEYPVKQITLLIDEPNARNKLPEIRGD